LGASNFPKRIVSEPVDCDIRLIDVFVIEELQLDFVRGELSRGLGIARDDLTQWRALPGSSVG
jgi:hypothetical protein